MYFLLQQVAGYVTEYDVNGFKFVTVKGSGHMVRRFCLFIKVYLVTPS